MCGINGIAGLKNVGKARQLITGMNNALNHRGPDDRGIVAKPGIALGHRRLSIIDLSSAGHQPMFSADKRLCLTFNGEIYNFKTLKDQLPDYPFATQTDTELILAAYQKWGVSCLDKLQGMFAFAIWDRETEELFIARDRLGIKPLYYFYDDNTLLFSSEIRSLLESELVPRKLNAHVLDDYLRYQTVHAPATIIQDVNMLMPGHFMIFKNGQLQIREYWNLAKNKSDTTFDATSYDDVTDKVASLLNKAVEKRLMADVPFGAFLSGGIDSSVIVGLMSQLCNQKVNTFSVSFDEAKFDESRYARIIANRFNTTHTEIRLQPKEFLALVPDALDAMDHPSGDGPNTYVVSKVTKDAGITVALSGLGGDEVFAGYSTFTRLTKLAQNKWLLKVPSSSRNWVAKLLKQVNPGPVAEKISKVLELESWDINKTYPVTRQVLKENQLLSILNRDKLQPNRVEEILHSYRLNGNHNDDLMPSLSKVSIAEISTYMQNVLLRDTDQMSMASALEVRVPFLDHQLVEYVLAIPDKYKYPSSPKKLLIDSTKNLLPNEVVNRPKMGFTLPWEEWLKTELKDFCVAQLQELGKRKEFNAEAINALWKAFLGGDARVGWARIWILVVLAYWLDQHNIED